MPSTMALRGCIRSRPWRPGQFHRLGRSRPDSWRAFHGHGDGHWISSKHGTDDDTGRSGGLASSPGCTGAPRALLVTPATYGTNDASVWSSGVGTFTRRPAYNAQTGAKVTVNRWLDHITTRTRSRSTHADHPRAASHRHDPDPDRGHVRPPSCATAYDLYGNVKADEDAGTLGGLAPSPGCTAAPRRCRARRHLRHAAPGPTASAPSAASGLQRPDRCHDHRQTSA